MNSATPVFLALLLVCSLPVMALVAADPGATQSEPIDERQQETHSQTLLGIQQDRSSPTSVDNTTNRLELTGEVRNEHTEFNPGLAMGLAQVDNELRVDADQYALVDREFDTASADERAAMIDAGLAQLGERIDELEERERTAVRAHANDELSNEQLLSVLLQNSHEVDMINDAFLEMDEQTDSIPGYSITRQQERAYQVGDALGMHQTPIRDTIEAAGHGAINTGESRVQIRTSESGYSLAMIDEGSYLVETTRFDHRDTDASDQFAGLSSSERLELPTERYPWAADREGGASFFDYGVVQLYGIQIDINNLGYIRAYLDGGTGEVHREYQELTLSELPITEQRTWTEGGLEVSLNETPANGPVEITVHEASTGDPEAATISIDGVEVGETDPDDGTLWYVPPTDEYELSIETSTRSISTTVTDE